MEAGYSGQLGKIRTETYSPGGLPPVGGGSGNGTFDNVFINPNGAVEVYNVGMPGDVNFEKVLLDWSGNFARLLTSADGTGVERSLTVGTASTNMKFFASTTTGFYVFSRATSAPGAIGLTMPGIWGASSGINQILLVNPTINQSGTAGYTALDVNPTETSVGSGNKLLQRWAVGGTQQASVDTTGFGRFRSLGTFVTNPTASLTLTPASDGTQVCNATSGAIVVTLPTAASASGKIYNIKKIDASVNTVTIDANAAETIDGALTKVLALQYQSVQIQSDGTQWWILATS